MYRWIDRQAIHLFWSMFLHVWLLLLVPLLKAVFLEPTGEFQLPLGQNNLQLCGFGGDGRGVAEWSLYNQ